MDAVDIVIALCHEFSWHELPSECLLSSEQQAARNQQVAPGRALHRLDH